MAATKFRCPRCRTLLEKGAGAFVMGWAGYKPRPDDPLPPSVTCPRCAAAIPTGPMVAGDYDEKADWFTPLALVLAGAAGFAWRYGYDRSAGESWGVVFAALCALVGAGTVFDRVRDALKKRG